MCPPQKTPLIAPLGVCWVTNSNLMNCGGTDPHGFNALNLPGRMSLLPFSMRIRLRLEFSLTTRQVIPINGTSLPNSLLGINLFELPHTSLSSLTPVAVQNQPLLSPLLVSLSPRLSSPTQNYSGLNVQRELFPSEIHCLGARHTVASSSSILSLHPFLDSDGILRVGGRLRHAPLPYDTRHPIILASHPLVHLIISKVHLETLHGDLQLTLRTLRHEFWVFRARSLVKSIIHKCIPCVRERASIPTQLMGDLPAARVSPPMLHALRRRLCRTH